MNYLTVPRLEQIPNLIHGFGTTAWKLENIIDIPGCTKFHPAVLNQVHSDIIRFIEEDPPSQLRGDAMMTNRPLLLLVIKTADCLPVFLVDEAHVAVAALHCGWKGTGKRLPEKVVNGMKSRFSSEPSSLVAAFGPSIGAACYEVGEDIRRMYAQAGLPDRVFRRQQHRQDKYYLDLKEANRYLLLQAGVREENIFSIDICTHCDIRFFSYRRDREKTGRLFNFIGLAEPNQLPFSGLPPFFPQ